MRGCQTHNSILLLFCCSTIVCALFWKSYYILDLNYTIFSCYFIFDTVVVSYYYVLKVFLITNSSFANSFHIIFPKKKNTWMKILYALFNTFQCYNSSTFDFGTFRSTPPPPPPFFLPPENLHFTYTNSMDLQKISTSLHKSQMFTIKVANIILYLYIFQYGEIWIKLSC